MATRPNRTKCPRRRLPTLLWSRKGSHGKHELQHRQSTFPLHTARRPPPRCYHAGKILRCTVSLAAFRSHRRFSEVGLVQVWCRQQREQQQQRRRRRRRLVSIASSSASTETEDYCFRSRTACAARFGVGTACRAGRVPFTRCDCSVYGGLYLDNGEWGHQFAHFAALGGHSDILIHKILRTGAGN